MQVAQGFYVDYLGVISVDLVTKSSLISVYVAVVFSALHIRAFVANSKYLVYNTFWHLKACIIALENLAHKFSSCACSILRNFHVV